MITYLRPYDFIERMDELMIVKITEQNNDELYAPRFEEITKALSDVWEVAKGDEKVLGTTNLPEKAPVIKTKQAYFENIEYIMRLQNGRYLFMPLDEEPFEIDANTRTITVPAHFKKNGIAVVGDQKAEIVYFTVDRYYDIMDLKNTKIGIKWQLIPDDDKNHPIYGIHPAFCPDAALIKDKITFGWIITRDMTQRAGKLKFSIVFANANADLADPGVAQEYALNTLESAVVINNTLTIKEPVTINDQYRTSQAYTNFLKNSIINKDEVAVDGPLFYKVPDSYVNLDETRTVEAQAYSPAIDSQVNYTWSKRNDKMEYIKITAENGDMAVAPEDVDLSLAMYYYKTLSDSGEAIYTRATYQEKEDYKKEKDPESKLYVQTSKLVLPKDTDVTGYYSVAAIATTQEGKYSSQPTSRLFEIPKAFKPKDIVITANDETLDNGTAFYDTNNQVKIEIDVAFLEGVAQGTDMVVDKDTALKDNSFYGVLAVKDQTGWEQKDGYKLTRTFEDADKDNSYALVLQHTKNGNTVELAPLNLSFYHLPTELSGLTLNLSYGDSDNGVASYSDEVKLKAELIGDVKFSQGYKFTLYANDVLKEVIETDDKTNKTCEFTIAANDFKGSQLLPLKVGIRNINNGIESKELLSEFNLIKSK